MHPTITHQHSSKFEMDISHKDHIFSLIHHFSIILSLLLCITIQTFFLLFNYHQIYYLIPISLALWFHHLFSPSQTYIIDFSCLKPPMRLRVPNSSFQEHLSLINCFDTESISFMSKIISSSGIGNETYFPPSLHLIPPSSTHENAIQESHMLLFPIVNELFAKMKVSPCHVDLIVVNCSGFCPSPSLSSMIVNHYDMRSDVKSYSISGMGCGAGIIGIDIAKRFLEKHRSSSYALVVSTEIISTGWYNGNDKRKLLLNCAFRMGCAAVLLTNKVKNDMQTKYKLTHLLRTQNSYNDRAYNSAQREEDDEGITGFSIERHVGEAMADLVGSNLKQLGSVILPWDEKLRYVVYCMLETKYVPNFAKAMKHLCIPASSQKLIKTVGKGLGLPKDALEAIFATFHRYGNQSSSSMWYQMAYMEGKGKIAKGDRVLLFGLGSGLKCNSLVLECVRDIGSDLKNNPWSEFLHRYPAKME